jgi:hypothetical protein
MDDAEEKRDWRGYAAWGSFLCGALSLVTDMAIEVSMEYAPKMPHSPWEVRYFLFTAPISFLGIVLGLLGKDTPSRCWSCPFDLCFPESARGSRYDVAQTSFLPLPLWTPRAIRAGGWSGPLG